MGKKPWKTPERKFELDMDKLNRKVIAIVLLALIISIGFLAYYNYPKNGVPVYLVPALYTQNYTEVQIDVDVDDGVVALTSGCNQIIAGVEPYQAESIKLALMGQNAERPNSHDIVTDAFDSMDIEVVMVKITEVKDSKFHGRLIIRKDNKIVDLESRPSDATAIALRKSAPIYVKNNLLEEYGRKIC